MADYLTQWVTKACARARLSNPQDVALLGGDNCREICEYAPVAVSSIHNNAHQHGYQGAKLLNDLLNGSPAPAAPIRVPSGALHVRQSTSILAMRHPRVATALRFIAEHCTEAELTPGKVAALVPMSKRRLLDAFLRYFGLAVYEEILERRTHCAMQLIETTDRKLADIAECSDFGSAEMMSRLFRRKWDHAPSAYRILLPQLGARRGR